MSIKKQLSEGWPMTVKPLKNCFVVVMDNGHTCLWSIAWRKKDCIAAYASGIGESDTIKAWESAKKRGHRVIKVNISFDISAKR